MSDVKSEQFSLQWNNFHTNLSSGFHAFLQGQNLVDVTLAAGGKFIQAHKLVLSVCSSYFKDLFEVNPCKHPIVIMKDVGHKELEAILEFMYRGETNVCQDDLSEFLKTAEMLQVKGLADNESTEDQNTPGPSKAITRQAQATHNVPEKLLIQAPKRERSLKAAPPEVSSQPFKRVKHEPSIPESSGTSAKPPAMQSPVPAPSPPSSQLLEPHLNTEPEHSKEVEHLELAQPKMELVEIEDSDVEEVDNGDDFSFFGGESSQSFQDTSGAGSLPDFDNLSQYANMLQEDGQGMLEFIQSARGRPLLVHDDYLYRLYFANGPVRRWRCINEKSHKCKSRVFTLESTVVDRTAQHNHQPHTAKIMSGKRFKFDFPGENSVL